MGLFNLFFTNRAARNGNGGELKALREPKSKWYRIVQTIAIILIVLGAALLIMSFFFPALNKNFDLWLKVSLVMIALGGGGLFTLPWVFFLERNKRLVDEKTYADKVNGKFKYIAFAFFAAIGVCTVLWIIAVFTVHVDTFTELGEVYAGDKPKSVLADDGMLVFLAVAIILSLQVGIASFVTSNALRFRKKFLAVRVIQYVSLLIIDIWLSWIAGALFGGTLITYEANGNHSIATPINPLHGVVVIAILAAIALLVTVLTVNRMVYRERMDLFTRGLGAAYTATDDDIIQGTFSEAERISETGGSVVFKTAEEPAESAPSVKSAEEQLATIADLRDRGLITEEEYNKKRQDIIDKL